VQAERIRSSAFTGPFYGAAIIVSGGGKLDIIVAQTDYALAHFSYDDVAGWSGPTFLPGQAVGPPAFIQSRFGRAGNFEVIVPRPGGGLSHFWRDNDAGGVWHQAVNQPADDGAWLGVGLIHSNFGNLEIAGVKEGSLHFLWQNGQGGAWSAPEVVHMDSRSVGRPAFIQSTFGARGNFEVVVAKTNGGLAHYWRNNDDPHLAWIVGPLFDAGSNPLVYRFEDVTMFQSSYGRLEVFAAEKSARNKSSYNVIHYRSGRSEPWEGPIKAVAIPYDGTWWP
jgi:hypothetical protein